MDQRIELFSMDFTSLRLCILSGLLRMFLRNEIQAVRFNRIDVLFIFWMAIGAIIYVLQWADMSSIIYKMGVLFDGFGFYWLFRQMIRKWEDISSVVSVFAILAIVSAPLILLERILKSSPYAFMGYSQASMHRGRFRCSGPFPHYIMMGLFWTSLLPWFYSFIRMKIKKYFYWTAIGSGLFCMVMSNSSTPLLTLFFMSGFWFLYPYRRYGRQIFFIIAAILMGLHLLMESSVWHLMARVDIFSGSTGWHRYFLFDQFIRHTSEWFFLGTRSTAHWGMGLEDVTNQYVLEAVRGGFLTLCIFLWLNVLCVTVSGQASMTFSVGKKSWLSWGICISVLGHIISFWGVSYFGQIIMIFYLTIVLVAFLQEQISHDRRPMLP